MPGHNGWHDRRVEGGQEAVAGGVDLSSAEPCQFLPHDAVVLIQERAPIGIADGRGSFGGADDVSEHDGEQPAVGVGRDARAGEELLDLVDDVVGVLQDLEVVGAFDLDVPGVGNPGRGIPAELRRD